MLKEPQQMPESVQHPLQDIDDITKRFNIARITKII